MLERAETLLDVHRGSAARLASGDRLALAASGRRGGALQPVRRPHAHPACRPARHRRAEDARRPQHAPVRRRLSGQQRAAHRRARHRQVLSRQGAAERVRAPQAAGHRDREAGSRRPARARRPGCATGPERFILYCDDLSFAAEEPGYQALKAVLDGSLAATSENLRRVRHLESSPSHARVHAGEPRGAPRRGRDPSGRVGGGEDLALRTLRPVGVVLPLHAGRVSRHRALLGQPGTARR